MKQHLLIVGLLTFSYLSFTHSDDRSDDYEYEFQNSEYCVNGGGHTCDPTCKILGNCIELGNTFTWILIKECLPPELCDPKTVQCGITITTCPEVPVGEIICNEQGQFPNPYNCTGYFICSDNGVFAHVSCKNDGGSYNACTEKCESAANCRRTKPVCSAEDQYGVIEDNERYFYYCVSKGENILPSMLKCDEGHIFSINLKRCIRSDNECTSESGTITTTQTPINCLYTGQRFPHSDCRKFNECDEDLQLTVITCTSGSHYDPVSTNCVYGACS